ncbi:chemotaxis protein CheW [Aphanothece hegewaldii CCALA 016]|uniref:Chemotaxis protein CheW n=1 Tax=Aphanothece hegewaldii CCALA 016 TaxID=2107694 RepID=A0A2T1M278_9CHRO|nr:CheW domain-containing protein [Aphanothece hegewaldii]PSF38861.1 chemotaxis protein CheW [Aphanothece hegewaldii CCALA 016]
MSFEGFIPSSVSNFQKPGIQEQFLRFYLVPETTVMLPVTQLIEVLTIPIGQIIPIPQMPSWVMGVYNWRGEVLWMVDLGHLLGLTPTHQQTRIISNYRAIVINNTQDESNQTRSLNQMLGLVVSQVEDIELCNPDEIQSPPASAISLSLAPFLRGYWLNSDGDLLIVLDGAAILAAMPK